MLPIADAQGERAPRIDDEHALNAFQPLRERLGLQREPLRVSGEEQRKPAALVDERDRPSYQRRRRVDRVARLCRRPPHVTAPYEESLTRPRSHRSMRAELADPALRRLAMGIEARDGTVRPLRPELGGEERRARVEQRPRDIVLVIAGSAAREAPGARPRRTRERLLERHVASRREVRGRHLAPRRERLPRLGVRHGARAPTQLRAEDALLERVLARAEGRQPAEGAIVGARHSPLSDT